MDAAPTASAQDQGQDLGPLAWVIDEVRKALAGAAKAVRRFVREAESARESDLAALDVAPLRIASQQLHQAGGALGMAGMEPPALLLRTMEAAVHKYVQRPDTCNDDAAGVIERASFALVEYLECVLAGKPVSPVALFPQYRDTQALLGVQQVHPADLWPADRRSAEPDLPVQAAALPYGPQARARLDSAVLRIVKSADPAAAAEMRDTCLGFVAAQAPGAPRRFWKVAAGFFDAVAGGLLPADVYVKRAASRVLLQYAALAKGEPAPAERLVQDLLFFCAQAQPAEGAAPFLQAVRGAFQLDRHHPVDYDQPRFGRFDPILLAQARKRIAAAAETWSALAGGDRAKLKPAADQFSLVCDSLTRLLAGSGPLGQALTRALDATVRSGEPPAAALAMEVATAVLYLQATFDDLDATGDSMAERARHLAGRLDQVLGGAPSAPLEPWMEELYRRVSDRQTMGSVVDELRATLGEAEKSLDQFFRAPADLAALAPVPGHLAQMRGVLSVLGLDQASLAVARMRDTVDRLLGSAIPEPDRPAVFEKLGNNLGALGFLIDMLGYQRAMARKLFVYDDALGELRVLMGRTAPAPMPEPAAPPAVPVPPPAPEPAPAPEVEALLPDLTLDLPPPAPAPAAAPLPASHDQAEDELLSIFLDEAREVTATGLEATEALGREPGNLSEQTTLRRAFHTLKGSSRMVGLDAFGEAGWALEQMLNAWLAEQKPMPEPMRTLAHEALQGFAQWAEAIAQGDAGAWQAEPFQAAADAMRLRGERLPLVLPGMEPLPEPVEAPLPEPLDFADTVFDLSEAESPEPAPAPLPEVEDLDFSAFAEALAAQEAAPEPPRGPAPKPEPEPEVEPLGFELSFPEPVAAPAEPAPLPSALEPELPPEPAPEPELAEAAPLLADEAVKVIDSLRIPIPLYNVYLNEADEWSRRLVTCLQEWSLELHEPLPDQAMALAHSLAGSSATVGFGALSDLARLLEHALQHVQWQPRGLPAQAQTFVAAAEDMRRLLHQFAAGFLKTPQPQVLEALRAVLDTQAVVPEEPAWADEVVAEAVPAPAPAPIPEPAAQDAAPVAVDDDIDAVDVIDPDLFPIFEEEAVELLPSLGAALRQWSARPENLGARSEVLRALHTLKGSARLAGAMRLGEQAHRLESAVEHTGTEDLSTEKIEPLLAGFDGLQAGLHALRSAGTQAAAAPPAESVAATAAAAAPAPLAAPAHVTHLAPLRTAANQSVRVRAQLLDRLVNQAGEVLIARSRLDARMGQVKGSLADLSGNLDRLRQQLRDIEVQAETQMQSRLALSRDAGAGFDPLEFDRFTRVQELTRMMAESVNDVATVHRNLQRALEGAEDDLIAQGRQARELQRDLLRTRMVEFDSIAERLYAVVRQAAKETGKQIKLDIDGGTTEMDRGVLDRMAPAFEHLLRNCVAHGIEPAEVRAAQGKNATGTITVALRHEGNDVSVEFRDDGAGLDLDRIRAKAVALGLVASDVDISPAQAAELIYTPGFSTAAAITGLAGRGIGMDVVRAEVQALGGRIETTSASGRGAAFHMVLPLTTAVTQVVMLRAGGLTVGVPANLVEIVRRTPAAALDEAYQTGQFDDGSEALPFFWMGALLQSSRASAEPVSKTRPVVILRSAAQRLALHVDEVLGNQEIVVKNLGPQLVRLPGLAGMSVLASGTVVLVYNPVALATVYGEQARAQMQQAEAPAAPASTATGGALAPLVLVVDDSITVRRVTQRLLLREGYRVALAADGLQALERLQEERPAVVLSDIEMPRMDGFDLVRNLRAHAQFADLPVIMITSRIAAKHREHASELGVQHYLGKPYAEEELLSLVRQYAVAAAQPE